MRNLILFLLLVGTLASCHKYTCYKPSYPGQKWHFNSEAAMQHWIKNQGGVTVCDIDP